MDTSHHHSDAWPGDEPRPNSKSPPAKAVELSVPASASLDELRHQWRRIYHHEPPKISRDLLMRGIGYRLQKIQHGGLGKSTRRKLKTLAKMFRTEGRVAPDPGLSLKPGARLVREWHGRTHTVTVTEDGFEYAGLTYPSLTKVAKKITGTPLVRATLLRPRAGGRTARAQGRRQWLSRASPRKIPVRHLYAKILRGGFGAGLQLARRAARSLRGFHSFAEA